MTLYRKYRPQTIEELDLEIVRDQLKKLSLSLDKMPHAFLFAGPRGAGKTSAARILAKLINCENPVKTADGLEPCNKCDSCLSITSGQSLDIIELDTASNRGIDDIRSLRESIALSPVSAKKKIYIMDEAHMLTVEAANAFLKTLEEPPSHALFILATTDPHKLPETVRSRLTLISFMKANNTEIARQLKRIAEGEKLKIEDEAIELISKKVDGSFREAVKILEALSLEKEITKEVAEKYLFSGSATQASDLVRLILEGNTQSALSEVSKYADGGGSIKDLIDDMQSVLRAQMLENVKNNKSSEDEINLIKALMEARANLGKSLLQELPLEIVILESANKNSSQKKTEILKETSPVAQRAEATTIKAEEKQAESKPPEDKKKDSPPVVHTDSQIDASLWSEVLLKTRAQNTALEAVLRTAKPLGLNGNTFELAVYYQFHKERLETEQYRRMVEKVLEEVLGLSPAKLSCTLAEIPDELKPKPATFESLTKVPEPDIIQAAKEIFGE